MPVGSSFNRSENPHKPAPNYVEMSLRSPKRGSVVVIVQRVAGKTPRRLQADAERERDAKQARLNEIADGLIKAIDNRQSPNEHEDSLRSTLALAIRK